MHCKCVYGKHREKKHLDDFNILFNYESSSNNSIVTMSHGASIKMEGSDLAMPLRLNVNEILCGTKPIVSLFMVNVERYTALCVYTGIQNQLVGDGGHPYFK